MTTSPLIAVLSSQGYSQGYPQEWATGVALPMIALVSLIIIAVVVNTVRAVARRPRGQRRRRPSGPTRAFREERSRRGKLTTTQVIIATLLGDPNR